MLGVDQTLERRLVGDICQTTVGSGERAFSIWILWVALAIPICRSARPTLSLSRRPQSPHDSDFKIFAQTKIYDGLVNLRLRSIVCAARHCLPRVMLLGKARG